MFVLFITSNNNHTYIFAFRWINNGTFNGVYWQTKTSLVTSSDQSQNNDDSESERDLLIGIILGVCLLVLALIILAIYLWLRGEQRYGYRINQSRQSNHQSANQDRYIRDEISRGI